MRFRFAAILTVGAVVAGVAQADSPPATPREACRASAISLCPMQAAMRDRDAVRACLIKNLDKASPECQAAVKLARDKMMAARPDATPAKP